MKDTGSGDLVEILDMAALIDPNKNAVKGRFHAGEEMQEPQSFAKAVLQFPSGEKLPRCWMDTDYKG